MSVTDELLRNNEAYAAGFDGGERSPRPARRVAVVACMDARLDVFAALGLAVGDAHVIRNAGGIVTDDVVRSLMISQRLLGTQEVVLVHHTDCGMASFRDEDLAEQVLADTGARPPFRLGAFADVDEAVRDAIARLRANRFLPNREHVRGFVFDVRTGRLREVT